MIAVIMKVTAIFYLHTKYSLLHTLLSLSRIFVASLLGSAKASFCSRNKNKVTLLLILGRCGNCRVSEFSDIMICLQSDELLAASL